MGGGESRRQPVVLDDGAAALGVAHGAHVRHPQRVAGGGTAQVLRGTEGKGLVLGHQGFPIPGIPRAADPRLLGGRQLKGTGTAPGCGGRKPHPDRAATMFLYLTLAEGMLFMCSIISCLQQQLFPPKRLLWPGWSWFRHAGVSLAPVLQRELKDRTRVGGGEGTWPWSHS